MTGINHRLHQRSNVADEALLLGSHQESQCASYHQTEFQRSSAGPMIVKHHDIGVDFHCQRNGFSFSGAKWLRQEQSHARSMNLEALWRPAKR